MSKISSNFTDIKHITMNLTVPNNHPDLQVLCKHTNTDPSDLRGAGRPGVESNYLKVHSLNYWSEQSKEQLKSQIAAANAETKEYVFVLHDTTDYEVEFDDDRTWPASFQFDSIKK